MTEGYFGHGSMLRHVQEHRAVGQTYGQRALIIGATHPVPYVGTSASTNARHRPFMRLSATAEAFESIFFGNRVEADRVLATVHSSSCGRTGCASVNSSACRVRWSRVPLGTSRSGCVPMWRDPTST